MSDSDNLESESEQPPAKKAHYDILSSHHSQQSSQWLQNFIIKNGHHQDQLNTRHINNIIVNINKKERQKRYREKNREKLKQREAERRKRIQYLQSTAEPSTSSNTNRIELNNEETIAAISQSSSGLEKTRTATIQRNEPADEINALQKKKERQQRYREQNRDKLKHSEAERRRRLQNAEMITEVSNCPNIEFTPLQKVITDFINSRNKLTINTLNCQNIRKHTPDLQDSICQNSNFLLLTETWLPADESVDVPNFHCIAKFKRQNIGVTGVAIYKNNNTSHITTFNMDLAVQNATEVHVSQTSIAEMCASHVTLEDGSKLIMVVLYISPNKKINDIISFLHEKLFAYSHRGSIILKTNKDKLPLILAGDFNVNFGKDESLPLITFLQEEFQLQINNNPREPTTRCGRTIDTVFIRHLDNVMSNTFVTYFSYHRPIVTVISSEDTSNTTITEVTH